MNRDSHHHMARIRDWSLITGRGATKREGGGQVKFYFYEKAGEKSVSHAEGGGGGATSFGVVVLHGSLKF